MPGPLDGIRILDLSVALTGPLAVGMLCDQGAAAIKVDHTNCPTLGQRTDEILTEPG